ncbi:MAG TPA: energy transducer TonB, partial [Gemmatimonadaceae bacterium]|nr:energy transducer TonB [Gemmatimonadaceae bacterium]
PTRAALFDPSGATFCGCRGRERVVLSGAEIAGLREVFGDGESFDCDPVPLPLGWGTDRHGAVAIEFGAGARRVEMLLLLPAGQILVRLADGPRYALRGSPECGERWREFLGACARERSRSTRALLEGMLDHREHGATGSAAGSFDADSNCALPPAGAGAYEDGLDLPEPVARVQPEFSVRDTSGAKGATARVLVQALVCRDGTVHPDVRILQGVPGDDARVVAAVRRWTFRPARSRGRPVPTWVAIPFEVPIGR